jgi:hypothetical protein
MLRTVFAGFITVLGLVAVVGCTGDDAQDVAGTGGSTGGTQSGGATGGTGGSSGANAGTGASGSTGAGASGGVSGSVGTGGSGGVSGGVGGSAGVSAGNGGSAGVAVAGIGGGDAAGSASIGGSAGVGGATGGAGNGSAGAGGTTGGAGAASGGSAGTAGSSGGGGSAGSSGVTTHVFLLFGQSNMAGYARATDADKMENPRIRVLGFDQCAATGRMNNQWDVAVPPLHECGPGAVGPGDWFSKTLIQKLPANDTILLVPCALSGQAISVFSKGTDKYTWMVNRVKAAQQMGGVVEGMLFHQGESDCGNSGWPAKVKQLVTDLRTDLAIGNVPFLAGELPPASACNNHNPLVNQLPSQITNAHVISAQGLNLDPADTQWNMHFGHDDTVELGKRYEAKMAELLGL